MSVPTSQIENLLIENQSLKQQLRQHEDRYALFLSASTDGYWEWHVADDVLETSWQWKQTLGVKESEFVPNVSSWADRVHPEDKPRVMEDLQKHMRGEVAFYHSEYRIKHSSGEYRHFLDRGEAAFDGEGNPTLMVGNITDITARIEEERRLAESENSLATILDCMSEGILVIDAKGEFIYANENFSRHVGFTPEQMKGKTPMDPNWKVIHEDGSPYPGDTHPSSITLRTGKAVKNAIQGVFLGDKLVWLDANSEPMFHPETKELLGAVITFTDITEKRKQDAQIEFLAYHDYLTGLPNRKQLETKLQEMADANSVGSMAFMVIDLDRFKTVNDTLGHGAGDQLLCKVAAALQSVARKEDCLARYGGDEFVVVLPDVSLTQAEAIAQRFVDALEEDFHVDNNLLRVSASIGISQFPADTSDFQKLHKFADLAMYEAKQKGGSGYQVFNQQMHQLSAQKREIELALANAEANQQLSVVYQPQLDTCTNQIIGAEALMRFYHPQLGQVTPDKFIPVAEDSGQILAIGKWLIRNVFASINRWKTDGVPVVPISINLSAKQFSDPQLVDDLKITMNEFHIPAELVVFELTESTLIQNDKQTLENLRDIAALGIKIAIDDFGTGYSSLAYLRELPVHCLKIDRTFVRDIHNRKEDVLLAKTIIDLAKNFSLSIVAEGVETQEQQVILSGLGCSTIQGYLFSKPLELEAYQQFILSQALFSSETKAAPSQLCH